MSKPTKSTEKSLTERQSKALFEAKARPAPVVATDGPPEWLYSPWTAWGALLVAFLLAFTPLFLLNLVMLVALAVLTYKDRKRAGLPANGWTWAVILFGCIAYIFYSYSRQRADLKTCPRCAEHVKVAAVICRHCGAEFEGTEG